MLVIPRGSGFLVIKLWQNSGLQFPSVVAECRWGMAIWSSRSQATCVWIQIGSASLGICISTAAGNTLRLQGWDLKELNKKAPSGDFKRYLSWYSTFRSHWKVKHHEVCMPFQDSIYLYVCLFNLESRSWSMISCPKYSIRAHPFLP